MKLFWRIDQHTGNSKCSKCGVMSKEGECGGRFTCTCCDNCRKQCKYPAFMDKMKEQQDKRQDKCCG